MIEKAKSRDWVAEGVQAMNRRLSEIDADRKEALRVQRLNDAAPDLLAALQGLLACAGEELSSASDDDLLDGVGNGPDDLTREQAQAFLNARAAITKATGANHD